MTKKLELIVIGGSSGGVDAVMKIIANLSPDFYTPVIIVMHQSRNSKSSLAQILQSRTKIKVKEPDDKEKIMPKHIYVAPSDYHILVERGGTFSYNSDELVNFSRPSIDVLFETAADSYGPTLAGVLLTGANADGANGMEMIKSKGGITIVQNPATAESPRMPQSAIDKTTIDFILDLNDISAKLNNLDYGNN